MPSRNEPHQEFSDKGYSNIKNAYIYLIIGILFALYTPIRDKNIN